MEESSFDKYFNAAYNRVTTAHLMYYTLKALQSDEYLETFNRNRYFWQAALYALQHMWMLDLSKMYEKQNTNFDDIISLREAIHAYVVDPREQMRLNALLTEEKRYVAIGNLKTLRDNLIAHDNAKARMGKVNIHEEFPLEFDAVEDLFGLAEELLGEIKSIVIGEGQQYTYKIVRDDCARDVKDIIGQLEEATNARKKERYEFLNS